MLPEVNGNIMNRMGWWYRIADDTREREFVVESTDTQFERFTGRLFDNNGSSPLRMNVDISYGHIFLASIQRLNQPPYSLFNFSVFWYVEFNLGGTSGSTLEPLNSYVNPSGVPAPVNHYHIKGQDGNRFEGLAIGMTRKSAAGPAAEILGTMQDSSATDLTTDTLINVGTSSNYAFLFQFDFTVHPGRAISSWHAPGYIGIAPEGSAIPVPEPSSMATLGVLCVAARLRSRRQ
ncbi:MAG: hypothetical protein JNJ45_00655 [Chthonomonas sp.]|nr:hypothetical protein [Chthonomonas sp.]